MNRQETNEDVLILAIESSCDETAASVVKNGRLPSTPFMAEWFLRLRRESTLRRLTR